jgi:hypothetical protein
VFSLSLSCWCMVVCANHFLLWFICKGWQIFRSHFRFDPGEGSKIRFWDDVLCGDRALKEAFPGLFIIAIFKEASIADNVE